MVDSQPEPYRFVGTFTPHTHTLHISSSVTTMMHVVWYMPLGCWVTLHYLTEVEPEKSCQLYQVDEGMASNFQLQSWGKVTHCPQDATAKGEGVVLESVDNDTHHSFDDRIVNMLPFYTSSDGLYHLLYW